MSELRRTPLHDEHVALGAALTPFAGWEMPLRYSSEVAEHRAVREAAGLFDLSHMGQVVVAGPAAGRDLDGAVVGQVSTLAVGRARYTMLCAPDGGVLDDLIVYRTAEAEFLVVANAANAAVVLEELTARCPGSTVAEQQGTALIAIQGPAAAGVLAELVADAAGREALAALRYYACTTLRLGSEQVEALVARTGYTGEDGFELIVPAGAAPALWRELLAAGSSSGLVPAGLASRDSLRLEAGMPLYGNELDATTTPFDAGLGKVVRLDKVGQDGEPLPFVGREALAARASSPPARVLVGLRGLGRRSARPGYEVRVPDGPVAGAVTSGAPSPTLGYPVAMAYVTPEVSAEGTALEVLVRGRPEPVRVVPLPFYRRG